MKKLLKKISAFFKENGHKMFTFAVGLVFIGAVLFAVVTMAVKLYGVFVPTNIYTDANLSKTLYGGSVYEINADSEEEIKEGTAEYFENYISNFIKQGIPDFTSPNEIEDKYLISFGLWQAVTLNNTQGVYTYDSKGSFKVPASDVEMFGKYCLDYTEAIEHQSVDVCGEFSYNSLNKTYKIKSAGAVTSYLVPDVVDVKEGENDTYILTVDCYEENLLNSNSADPKDDPANYRKRVKITVQNMGIQNYQAATGNPVYRYMIQSMETLKESNDSTPAKDVELN